MKRIINIWALWCLSWGLFAQITGNLGINPAELSFSQEDGYDIVEWENATDKMQQTGVPELPIKIYTFVLPVDAEVTGLEITTNNRRTIEGSYWLRPVPLAVPIGNYAANLAMDTLLYTTNRVYPQENGVIVADRTEFGYHLITVALYPISYNPVSRKITICDLNYAIQYSIGTRTMLQMDKQSARRASAIKKLIRSQVQNPQDIERFAPQNVQVVGSVPVRRTISRSSDIPYFELDAIGEQIPDYIIITDRTLRKEFQRLADWKIQKGVPTIIKETEEIKEEYEGADLAEKIHNYLRDCYCKWGAGLWVLLGGDTQIIPARMIKGGILESPVVCPSDFYYADLNSTWNDNHNHVFGEEEDGMKDETLVHIGRASVEDTIEAATFVNKVLVYEKMNVEGLNKEYVMNHLLADAFIRKKTNNFLDLGAQSSLNNYLKNYPQIHKWYLFDHYNCSCSYHAPIPEFSCGEELTYDHFINALQNGGNSGLGNFHIVYHMDHSHPKCMGTSSLDKGEMVSTGDIDNLRNGNYLQIVISGGCYPAKYSEDCIAERFLNNPHGGAVAFIGNADVGISNESPQYREFINQLYGEELSHLGDLYVKMREQNFSYNKSRISRYRLHLLGDPEMPVWSTVPQNLDVSITAKNIEAGPNKISVKINNLPEGKEATLCLMKDNEAYASIQISDTLTHHFQFTPKTEGKMKITVTAHNFLPYERTLPVNLKNGSMLTISKVEETNGIIEPGKEYDWLISLKNAGIDPAKNIRATLSCNSPYIDIVHGTMEYMPIAPGSEGYGFDEPTFTFSVSPDAPEIHKNEWNAVCFYLTIVQEGTNIVDVDTFKVDLLQPKYKIISNKIVTTGDKDKIPEAGERVVVSTEFVNLRKVTAADVKWKITPIDSTLVNMRYDESPSWTFYVADHYETGTPLRFFIQMFVNGSLHDSMTVNIVEPPIPIDSLNVDFIPDENSISLSWNDLKGAKGYNIYRSNTENGSYKRLNITPLVTRYYKDEELAEVSPYYYKFTTLSPSGIESEKSSALKGWTVYPAMDLFPWRLSTISGNVSMGNAHTVDFDYDGQQEIVMMAHTYDHTKGMITIVRADGREPYDRDGNATTQSGFAEIDYPAEAIPTVTDLFGKGENNIIAITRNQTDYTQNYITCYSWKDNKPEIVWQNRIGKATYLAPIVTDIDAKDSLYQKEILYRNDANGSITVLDANGNLKASIGDCLKSLYGYIAVADLNNDGYKEIVATSENHLYIWNHDGTRYKGSNTGNTDNNAQIPFFSTSGHNIASSVVICDLDEDGKKDILVASRNSTTSYIHAIRQDGTFIGKFDGASDSSACIPYTNASNSGISHAISVGDINNDRKLEVVALGNNCVRVWDNAGNVIWNREIPGLFPNKPWASNSQAPLLADVDGDGAVDIVFFLDNEIHALTNTGADITGFPLKTTNNINGITIAELDKDGRSELVAGDKDGYIYAWKTKGKPSAIEWGRIRQNTEFTGEYGYKDP